MIARLFAIVSSAVMVSVFASVPAFAAEKVRSAVAARVIFAIPYWIAAHKGYFKDEGIETSLAVGRTSAQLSSLTRSGELDIIFGGPDETLADAMKGGPLRILAGVVRRPPLWLIAKPSIRSFADLRGANIGVLSLTEGSSKLLLKMTRTEGLAPSDIKLTAVGGAPTRWNLLKAGKIDAGMQPLPLNYEAETAGFNDLGWAGKYEPEWQFITVNASAAWTSRNAKTATGFIRALLRGQAFIASNPGEAAQIAAHELKSPVDLVARSLETATKLGILDPRLDVSDIGLQRIFENMKGEGAIPADAPFNLGGVFASDHLREAQRSLAVR
jgi:ABC-type nitrate/sulfonate/bicarbonate transport system substrate-binding protein